MYVCLPKESMLIMLLSPLTLYVKPQTIFKFDTLCRIDNNFMIKVADFGLSESTYTREYFREHKEEGKAIKLPVKWMAIESFVDGIFTEKTDVVGYCVHMDGAMYCY